MMSTKLIGLRTISQSCSARELADRVLEVYFNEKKPEFPINIFKMLSDFKVYYQFRPFKDIEGVYSPDSENVVATVAINSKRPYERQRFTAAHELCHHLKDHSVSISPTRTDDPIEKFADNFAGHLLAPEKYLLGFAQTYENNEGYLENDDVLRLSIVFGVSFMSLYWRLLNLKKIKEKPTKKFFEKYKAFTRIEQLNLAKQDPTFLANIVDSYSYIPQKDVSPHWLKLKNHLIYNDGRIEGLDLELEEVAEICTDLRIEQRKSKYFKDYGENKSIIETVGHYFICNHIFRTQQLPDRYELKELHKFLFKLSPNPELAGEFRTNDNEISGALIRTVPYQKILEELYYLDQEILELLEEISAISYSIVLEKAVKIHHRLTQIHPFNDGNGRISRALMNWLLKLRNLPPVYVEVSKKEDYFRYLERADEGDIKGLVHFFMEILLKNMIISNSELSQNKEQHYVLGTPDV
ncbi:Fic family protein [Paenibacillus sp. WLX2291]|uniref:Fic family protein n=1 Tax=Paenibacillus sp. WLX2291 TaxID=3296934 RepID=UPI0039843456